LHGTVVLPASWMPPFGTRMIEPAGELKYVVFPLLTSVKPQDAATVPVFWALYWILMLELSMALQESMRLSWKPWALKGAPPAHETCLSTCTPQQPKLARSKADTVCDVSAAHWHVTVA